MLERVLNFIVKHMPAPLDQGVDPKDVLNVVRPSCNHDDLGRFLNNGWNVKVMSLVGEIQSDKRCWTVLDDGELRYDVQLRQGLMAEFAERGLTPTDKDLKAILINAMGHSDYTAKLARGCRDLEYKLKGE